MLLSEAFIYFTSICTIIFVTFERIEKFSSKSDLELYYLLITMKRTSFHRPWHTATIAFTDKIFGHGKSIGCLIFPKISRVMMFTAVPHIMLFFLTIALDGIYHIKGFTLVLIVSLIICIILDFLLFTKTRTLMQIVSEKYNIAIGILYFAIDIISLGFLIFLAELLFVITIDFLAFGIPEITAYVLQVKIALRDGHPDWDETFYLIGLTGTPNILLMYIVNFISALFSTLIISAFILGLIFSKFKEKIPYFQNFIDNHTSVQEKPLQILGAFAVCAFSIIFWLLYALFRLVELLQNS